MILEVTFIALCSALMLPTICGFRVVLVEAAFIWRVSGAGISKMAHSHGLVVGAGFQLALSVRVPVLISASLWGEWQRMWNHI
jgi:hypothetical protein